MLQIGGSRGDPLDVGLLKSGLDPDRFYSGSPPPFWALLSNRPCQVGMKGALMFLGWDWVVSGEGGGGGQFPGRRGQAIWGSWWGQSELVLQLAAPVPLAIVPNWPGAQPPKWQLGSQAEGG